MIGIRFAEMDRRVRWDVLVYPYLSNRKYLMRQLLLVQNNFLLNENHKFLLELAGFEPVFVNSIDQAINLIEISRSFCSGFDLLIIPMSNVLKSAVKCLVKLKDMSSKIKIIIVDKHENIHRNQDAINGYLQADNVQFCDIDRMIFNIKSLFDLP